MATHIINKSFKFRIFANKTTEQRLNDTLFLCRDLYNCALQERRDAFRLNQISISYYDQARQLKDIKITNTEYQGIYSQVLQDVIRRLDKSFQSFFRRIKQKNKAGFPRFKGATRYNSFCYPQSGFRLHDNKLILSKIGTVKIKKSREIVGIIKQCSLIKELDKWFVSFLVETETTPLPSIGNPIGIDVGIKTFATLSDGTQINNTKYYQQSQRQLRVIQRSLARKQRGSRSYKKTLIHLRKLHQKIKNQRLDFQHKLSTNLIANFDFLAIEKLNIGGMSRGILSKQMRDVCWGSFFYMLRYKAECAGRTLKEVNPNYTSQTCLCGHREKKTLAERWHNCDVCGLSIDRDVLSAKIILLLGLSGKDLTKTIGL